MQDSREVQNKALKMSRIIRADKDTYLKLGTLQTSTNKGQVSLKGWMPENFRSLSYSQKKAAKDQASNSTLHQSIDSSILPQELKKDQSRETLNGAATKPRDNHSVSALSSRHSKNLKPIEEKATPPNLSPLNSFLAKKRQQTSSQASISLKPETVPMPEITVQSQSSYSIPGDELAGIPASTSRKVLNDVDLPNVYADVKKEAL